MRTNIELNERLVKQAFQYTDTKTKKDLVALALEEFVQNNSREDLSALRGKIHFRKDYDYKKLRKGR